MVTTQTNRYSTNISQISCQTGELETDSHPWEQRQLGEFISKSGKRNTNEHGYPSYSISNQFGFIPQAEQFDNHGKPLDADKSTYWIVPQASFAYNPARINVGSIGYWESAKPVIVSSLYEVFSTDATVDDSFLWQWFKSFHFASQIQKLQEGGVRQYFFFDKLQKSELPLPPLPEQHRIGEFFSTLDSLIAAAERQETLLRQKKQAYLQLMFPQEGETQPRLRFAGFSGDWEERRLGEVAEVVGGGTPDSANPQYWDGDIDWYTPSEIGGRRYVDESVRKITHEGLNNSSAKLLPKGSILFTSRASIGLMAFIRRPSSTNQGFQSLVPGKLVDPDFLFALGPFITRYAKTHAAGSTFVEISGKSLGKTPLMLPALPEQHLIGQFFSTLDSLITAAEMRVKYMSTLKNAYLQRMFA